MKFYLGTDRVRWLGMSEFASVPLFLSHYVLRLRKKLPRAVGEWALDSGGFTQLTRDSNGWPDGCEEPYVEATYRYSEAIGGLAFASQQDWMVEPWLLHGRTVREHQERTVANYLRLVEIAPDLPWLPVIQGWELNDYHQCVDLFATAGVDLRTFNRVGIGSVCRRQSTAEIGGIVTEIAARGISLHGFGVKTQGLRKYGRHLGSSDSMAWSFAARWEPPLPECSHGKEGRGKCNHCWVFALRWRERLLNSLEGTT